MVNNLPKLSLCTNVTHIVQSIKLYIYFEMALIASEVLKVCSF